MRIMEILKYIHVNVLYLQSEKVCQYLQWVKHVRKTTKKKVMDCSFQVLMVMHIL